MNAGAAREVARRWVEREAAGRPGFLGALLHGSVLALPADAPLPAGSDLDLLVIAAPGSAIPAGKRTSKGITLDVAVIPPAEIDSPGRILRTYRIAPSFAAAQVVADPTGWLAATCSRVAARYPDRDTVEERLADARANLDHFLASAGPGAPLPAQVTAWLFGAGALAHLVLVAARRNPTVRTRYLAARRLLEELGMAGDYPLLLVPLPDLPAAATTAHLDRLAPAFDLAARVQRTPVFFAADISPLGRPAAIDATRALVANGDQREALFWLVATWCRVMTILEADATPGQRAPHEAAFALLLADLGLDTPAGMARARERVLAALPAVDALTRRIMDASDPMPVDPERSQEDPMIEIDRSTPYGARVHDRLSNDRIGWLTTVGADGTPHPVPIWFIWDGESILVYTRPDSPKVANITARPHVSFSLDSDGRGGDIVVITGDAAVDPAASRPADNAHYLEKYHAGILAIGMHHDSFSDAYSTAIRITPKRLTGH